MTDFQTHAHPARFATADIPGVGGLIKQRPEDFLVDEIPAYEPSGAGEHIYMLIQKREMTTHEVVDLLARHFGIQRHAVGFAGQKDKLAITRQIISVHVPGKKLEDFPMLAHDKIAILWADYHTNKLRAGHLKGNRFSIRIRGVEFSSVVRAHKILEALERSGVPNRFGRQRFGMLGNNHRVGRAMIARDFRGVLDELLGPCAEQPEINAEARALYAAGKFAEAIDRFPNSARPEREALRILHRTGDAKRAVHAMDQNSLRFFVSAFQSAVFNSVLDRRIEAGSWASLRDGDSAFKHDSGGVFAVPDAADPSLAPRVKALEISPSGPLWSGKMMRCTGSPGEIEDAALASCGVSPDQLAAFTERAPQLIQGSRRPLRIPLVAPDAEGGADEHGPYIRCAFELPRGSFATAVLAEVMKNTQPDHTQPDMQPETQSEAQDD